MFKRVIKNALEWVLSGGIAILLIAMFLVGGSLTNSLAKEIFRLDLSRDDIYDAFASVVVDMNTLKDAIDDSLGSSSEVVITALGNETSADLTTDSTALSALGNETSADLTTDSTALALLVNEIDTDMEAMRQWMVNSTALFNVHIGLLAAHNGVSGGSTLVNTVPAIITAPIVTPATRTASVVTPATRTAPVVTPTAVSNATGTLTTTTP